MSYRFLKALGLIISLALLFLHGCCKQPPLGVAEEAPRCLRTDLKGNRVALPADFKGQALIVRFWSDCCRYGIHEMSGVDLLYEKYKARGLGVLAIYSGKSSRPAS